MVAFASTATNLVEGDTNGTADILIHEWESGLTELVSISSTGELSNGGSSLPALNFDGSLVSFASTGSNLVPNDTNAVSDIFVHSRLSGETARVSIDSVGNQATGASSAPSMSSDGRFVAFLSLASDLVANDGNALRDVFVFDRSTLTTARVTVGIANTEPNAGVPDFPPSISADGLWIGFASAASNLTSNDANNAIDAFVACNPLQPLDCVPNPTATPTTTATPPGTAQTPTMTPTPLPTGTLPANADYLMVDGSNQTACTEQVTAELGLTSSRFSFEDLTNPLLHDPQERRQQFQAVYVAPGLSVEDSGFLRLLTDPGGFIDQFVTQGGVAIINLSGLASEQLTLAPRGVRLQEGGSHDSERIPPDAFFHPYINGAGYGGEQLIPLSFTGWGPTDNGHLLDVPGDATVLLDNPGGPSLVGVPARRRTGPGEYAELLYGRATTVDGTAVAQSAQVRTLL